MSGLLPVIQADRDAVADLFRERLPVDTLEYIVAGFVDHDPGIQAFARHRIASTKKLVEALEGMVRLSEMGFETSLLEPEENGNFAAYERAKTTLKDAGK